MRRLALLSLLAALALPAAALAAALAAGDGTVAVKNGDGVIRLWQFRGAALGKIEKGTLFVRIEPEQECKDLLVWDADAKPKEVIPEDEKDVDGPKETVCIFTDRRNEKNESDLRFRFVGGEHRFRMKGQNMALSAVGRGKLFLKGSEARRDGRYSLNGGEFLSLPDPPDGRVFSVGDTPLS